MFIAVWGNLLHRNIEGIGFPSLGLGPILHHCLPSLPNHELMLSHPPTGFPWECFLIQLSLAQCGVGVRALCAVENQSITHSQPSMYATPPYLGILHFHGSSVSVVSTSRDSSNWGSCRAVVFTIEKNPRVSGPYSSNPCVSRVKENPFHKNPCLRIEFPSGNWLKLLIK